MTPPAFLIGTNSMLGVLQLQNDGMSVLFIHSSRTVWIGPPEKQTAFVLFPLKNPYWPPNFQTHRRLSVP